LAGAMSPKIGDGFSVKSYVPEFQGRCFPAKGYVPDFRRCFFRQSAMSPNIANWFNRWRHTVVQTTSTNQL